jgi:hypothetical protein
VNSPPPKPEVILTNFFAEPTVLLVPITSRDCTSKTILILHDFDPYLILILCATHHLDEIAIILFVCADR